MVEEKEELINNESDIIRCPKEFSLWLLAIQKEFNDRRGFFPSKMDIMKNIVKQFKGKFIV